MYYIILESNQNYTQKLNLHIMSYFASIVEYSQTRKWHLPPSICKERCTPLSEQVVYPAGTA